MTTNTTLVPAVAIAPAQSLGAGKGNAKAHVMAWRSLTGKKAVYVIPSHVAITGMPEACPWRVQAADAEAFGVLLARQPKTLGAAIQALIEAKTHKSEASAYSTLMWLFTWGVGFTLNGKAYTPANAAELAKAVEAPAPVVAPVAPVVAKAAKGRKAVAK